jgi:hypothetical protein
MMTQQRKRTVSRKPQPVVNPNRPQVNCLGVTSTQLREMGGSQGMQVARAVRKQQARATREQPQVYPDDDDYGDSSASFPIEVVENPRARRRQLQTGTRTSVFQRRLSSTPAVSRQTDSSRDTMVGHRDMATTPDSPAWAKVMTAVDQQRTKVELLTHRLDGLSEQLRKQEEQRRKGDGVDVGDLHADIEEVVEMVASHTQTLEEIQDIVDLVRDMDAQVRELHNSTHFFYAVAAQQVPCLEEPSFDTEGTGPGYIAAGERVMLISPQQEDEEGTIWVKARRIDSKAQIAEYWVPLVSEETDYFGEFEL